MRRKGARRRRCPVAGLPPPEPLPDEVTTVRARLTGPCPASRAQVYGEAEVDVKDSDRRILAAAANTKLPNRGRIYARHEFVSRSRPVRPQCDRAPDTTASASTWTTCATGAVQRVPHPRRDVGGDTEAAIGLRNLWTLARACAWARRSSASTRSPGRPEREHGARLGLEYTANPLWKGTTRLELRDATTAESILFTVGVAQS